MYSSAKVISKNSAQRIKMLKSGGLGSQLYMSYSAKHALLKELPIWLKNFSW